MAAAHRAGADFVVPPGPLTVELVQAMIHRPCSRMLAPAVRTIVQHDDRFVLLG